MASVYGIVRSLAKRGSAAPMLRSIVGRKSGSTMPGFVSLVETQIIPRLVIAHGSEAAAGLSLVGAGGSISAAEADAFAPLALDHGACALLDHVEMFLARGVSVDTIFVDLLAPAARHLGFMWEEDTADFIAVTMALWRLQEVVRELSSRVPARCGGEGARRALFSVMPGEQHSFGTVMVEDVFRRAGWSTELLMECDTSQLLAAVARNAYDLIGLTVTGARYADTVPSVINGIRSVSRNPHIGVMVGGRIFGDDPGLAVALGADATAADAAQALEVARTLVDELAHRHETIA